ncbi:MAG: NosD domain-containing protein [Methanocellales archaeon]|nr:NosD domain-containing protein [Methanocellales archaeon]MDD3292449.1 NosD domain-containing protein [Methanocellales archaeon]MDD5485928.1 NosD domain-containing protein [Methanocellales archaeon]
MRKSTPLLMLSCLAIALLLLASPAQASTTWYVDDDGGADFTTIQDAVNASTEGDTIIVRDGTYYENVVVNKSLTIRSENGSDFTTVQPSAAAGFKITADYVNISGFTVKGQGPYTYDPEWLGKVISHGFDIDHSNYCTITENTALCCGYGIHVGWYSDNNTVSHNNCSWNRDHGIKLDYSDNNTISHNICRGTWHDDNIDLTASTNNVISDNICIDGWDDGIYLSGSSYNTIVNNTCENNAEIGIHLTGPSNTILNNTISINSSRTQQGGITLCGNNTVMYNTITYTAYNVTYNIETLGNGGICSGENSIIYLNSNLDNVGYGSSANIWNSTEMITYTYNGNTYTNYLGNYWGKYNGTDADGDGIGDTPYYIESTEYDYYPLMEPFEHYFGLLGDVNNDGVVNVLDATKVKNRAGNPFYPLDNEWAADVNSDGIINVLDATKVKNRAADPNYPW